jgi:hypothetical protein
VLEPRWVVAQRPDTPTGEQLLLCLEVGANETCCILIQGNHASHRLFDIELGQARAFVEPGKFQRNQRLEVASESCASCNRNVLTRIDPLVEDSCAKFAQKTNQSGERAWAICSAKGEVLVLDSNLQLLARRLGPERSRLKHFFVDDGGVPTALVNTNLRLHDFVTQILKFRFSDSGHDLILETHPFLEDFVDACPGKPNVAILRHDKSLSCVQWTEAGSEVRVLRAGNPADSIEWETKCLSENWVSCGKRHEIRYLENPEVRFDFAQRDTHPLRHSVVFWASRSDPNLVWALHSKDLYRLRFVRQQRESLSRLAAVRMAEASLASIPDEQSRKWFAAAIANMQQTNHTIKSTKQLER